MKRPHRSIETFDISLMAVVTKAMGAFLVLMLLLVPYYTSDPLGQKTADELAEKVDEVDKKIKEVAEKLKEGNYEDLRKQLEEALAQLEEARKILAELRREIDQLNSQIKRLTAENEELKKEVAELKQQVADLNAKLAAVLAQIETLNAKIAQLESEFATLKDEIARLQQENEELKRQIEPLKQEIARLQKENDELRRIVDPLKAEVAKLRQENEELKKIVDPLKARIAELEEELKKLRGWTLIGQAFNWDCDSLSIYPALAATSMTVTEDKTEKAKYIFDRANGLGWSGIEPKPGFTLGQTFLRGQGSAGFFFILVSRGSGAGLSRRNEANLLKRPAGECQVLVTLSYASNTGIVDTIYTNYVAVNTYVTPVTGVVAGDGGVKTGPLTPEAQAWIDDQVAHAEKDEEPAEVRSQGAAFGARPPNFKAGMPSIQGMKAPTMPAPGAAPSAPIPQGVSPEEQKALESAPSLAPDAAAKLRQGLRGSSQGLEEGLAKQKAPGASPQPKGGGN